MITSKINPLEDGISHINIYSRGKTLLGRELSNFSNTPFTYNPYGGFASVEAFWYWYLTGCKHHYLKDLYGYKAKQEGKKLERLKCDISDYDKDVILEAIRCKLRQNKKLLGMLIESTLPLEHYYVYGDKVIQVTKYSWITDEIDRIRKVCQESGYKI